MNTIALNCTGVENEQLVELVEEITARLQAGEPCDIDGYAARYPEYADRLRDWMTVMSAMADLGHSLAVGAASRAAHPASSIEHPARHGESSTSSIGLLGDFRILREIGRGGMGVVYEAEQISIGRRVALKVLPFAAMLDKQQLNRFKNEARAAGTLDHPNIVAIHSVGVERGVHYYAMQLIEGQSLAQIVDQLRKSHLPLPPGEGRSEDKVGAASRAALSDDVDLTASSPARLAGPTADTAPIAALPTLHAPSSTLPAYSSREYFRSIAQLGIQAAKALDHAHQNGILHRDIKPANLMVDETGKLWITDFGLARLESDAGMTMTGDILGTLRYMSPEQALAKRVVVDHRSDIYSLGVTLYELLTLHAAFTGDDRHELLRQIAFEEPRNLRHVNARIPQDLETIVLKAIEKNPADRYATAQELADDLQRFRDDHTIKAKRPNIRQQITKWARRNQRLVAGAAFTLTLFMVASTVATILIWREKDQTQEALLRAQEQQTRAERSAAESKALVQFFVDDLLGAGEPEKALDDQVTVQEVVEEAERKIETGLNDQPLVEASIRQAIGKVHLSLGNPEQAEKQFLRAREIQQHLLGSGPETLETMSLLAVSLRGQQRLVEARQLFEQTLELKRRVLGSDHPDTLKNMDELAVYLVEKGQFDRAQKVLEEALEKMRGVLGADDVNTLHVQHTLANLVHRRGNPEQGRKLIQEVLETTRRVLGDENPRTLEMEQDLAATLEYFGQYDEARKLYEHVLEARQRIYGRNHSMILGTVGALIELLRKSGDYEQAFKLQNVVEERLTRELGPEHQRTLAATVWRANLLKSQGKWRESQELFQRVLDTKRRTLGSEHANTVSSIGDLADLFVTQGKLDDARILKEQRLEVHRRVDGPESENAAMSMHELACVIAAQDKHEEAQKLLEETIALRRRVLGAEHYVTLVSMQKLAELLGAQGKHEQAIELYRQVIEIEGRVLGSEHYNSLATIHNLACVYDGQGNHTEALKLKKQVLEVYRRTLGPTHESTLICLATLAATHSYLGQYDEAIKLLRERLELLRRVLGPEHRDILHTANQLADNLSKQGKKGAAAEIAELNKTAFEMALATYGQEHAITLKLMNKRAGSLKDLGQYDEACRLSRQAVDISRRVQGAEHPDTLRFMRGLGFNLRDQGNYDEARPMLEETIELQRRTLGADHTETLSSMRSLADLLIKQGHRREAYELDHLVGTLHYRATRWSDAAETLNVTLEHVDDAASKAASSFYLAMANFQMGERDKAQSVFAQAIEALGEASVNEELVRLRDEAAALLAISKKPTTNKAE